MGILAAGLILGWLIFGNASTSENDHEHSETTSNNEMWTCSMHPQIMQKEAGDCPICGMDLIPASSQNDGLAANQFRMTENAMALANIQTLVLGDSETGANSLRLSGKIVENEESNVVQVSYFSGRIEQLNINFKGEKVTQGQLLATIYSPELYAAQQELITASSMKSKQPNLYRAVRNKLKIWKLTDAQIDRIENTGKVEEYFPIYATVSGTVSEKLVEQGETVKQGQALFKIADLTTVWANFDVYENQINLLKKGQDILISTQSIPGKVIKAKVDFIDPILDVGTRTLKLRSILDNRSGDLKPGMFIEGKVQGMNLKQEKSITVPATAVLWTGERSVVYVKTNPEEPIFQMREVKLGSENQGTYEVLEGLSQGEEIVANGTFSVDAAAQLRGKRSMMNKSEGETAGGHSGHDGRMTATPEFQEQLQEVFNAYVEIKEALARDEFKTSSENALAFLEKLGKVEDALIGKPDAQGQWSQLAKGMESAANSITKASNIEGQRKSFNSLSTDLTQAIHVFGIEQRVYRQFCPMVDNNKGGYWLSADKEIRNPYFGSAMHSCGNVAEIID